MGKDLQLLTHIETTVQHQESPRLVRRTALAEIKTSALYILLKRLPQTPPRLAKRLSFMANNTIDIHSSSSLSIQISSSQASKMTSNSPSVLPKPEGWWKSLTSIYQIYPSSYIASGPTPKLDNPVPPIKDHLPPPPTAGLGDLKGITSKLPYLQALGVDCIWLSPCYEGPLIDMGYDIADYTKIDPRFGTNADIDMLIHKAHSLNIRVLLDLVINHTSDQHKWFRESQKSSSTKYSDYYIWKDPKYIIDPKSPDNPPTATPPNNWASFFGGSAWTFVPSRQQYYLHLFDYRQPDLNWESPTVRKAIYDDAIRFWLDRGIDGFRVDTCAIYSKDPSFPDGDVDPKHEGRWGKFANPAPFVVSGPHIHEYWQEIRKDALDKYGDVLMIGELGPIGHDNIMRYIGRERREMSMVFDFLLNSVGGAHEKGFEDVGTWKLRELKEAARQNQELGMDKDREGRGFGEGWNTVVCENHDLPRSVSRFGSGSLTYENGGKFSMEYWERSAKLIALMIGTMSGTLVMYQGQEIGMTNIPQSWNVKDLMDLASIEYYQRMEREHPGDKEFLARVWKGICALSRDNARTPMQWSDEENAGFSEEKPWMRVNDNYKEINIKEQEGRQGSVLEFWKRVLKLRKNEKEVFIEGKFKAIDTSNEKLFGFEKIGENGKGAMVFLNFSEDEVAFSGTELKEKNIELTMSNVEGSEDKGKLKSWEGKAFFFS